LFGVKKGKNQNPDQYPYQEAIENYRFDQIRKLAVQCFSLGTYFKHLHFGFLEMALLFILSLLFLPVAKSQVSVAYEIYLSSFFLLK
jgi:hypothetical protein